VRRKENSNDWAKKPEPPANGNTNKQSNRKLSPKGKTNQPQGEAKMELGYQP
jgi:hypothetical protein